LAAPDDARSATASSADRAILDTTLPPSMSFC
jgi:hypothetical protein